MEEKLDLLLFDKSNNLLEGININKPETYNDLVNIIETKFKKLPKYYNILFQTGNNKEIIDNNEKYKLSEDILFIYEADKDDNLEKSLFSLNFSKLSDSKQEILNEKYSCPICEEIIKNVKNGKPLLCYQCQNIFHKACLENWGTMCLIENKIFNCPKCKYELSLAEWKEKVNYEDERNQEIDLISRFNINEKKLIDLEKKHNEYIEDILKKFNIIINTINEILSLINNDNDNDNDNNKLNNKRKIEYNNPNDMSYKILEGLKNIENFVKDKINENITDDSNIIKNCEIINENCIKNDSMNDNYIISELEIKCENEENRIINSYEEYCKAYKNDIKEEFKNEKEIKDNIEIIINDKPIPFSYFYKSEKKGKYSIKYKFRNLLKNTNYMFALCKNLTSINISNFKFQNVTNMSNMFLRCESLTNIDLSNIDTEKVTNMKNMFCNCESLANINLSNFKTENVTDMSTMFFNCQSLTDINVSNFETQKVIYMSYMFYGCKNLKNLDLSNFDTHNVIYMNYMFSGCKSLTNINLSSFNTSNVINMSYFLARCESLTNINISNFDTQKVTNMSSMFEGCKSLNNINLSTFNTSNTIDMSNMFDGCKSLTNIDLSNFKIQNVTKINSMFHGCLSLLKSNVKTKDKNTEQFFQ